MKQHRGRKHAAAAARAALESVQRRFDAHDFDDARWQRDGLMWLNFCWMLPRPMNGGGTEYARDVCFNVYLPRAGDVTLNDVFKTALAQLRQLRPGVACRAITDTQHLTDYMSPAHRASMLRTVAQLGVRHGTEFWMFPVANPWG